jgi:hypothetical protein
MITITLTMITIIMITITMITITMITITMITITMVKITMITITMITITMIMITMIKKHSICLYHKNQKKKWEDFGFFTQIECRYKDGKIENGNKDNFNQNCNQTLSLWTGNNLINPVWMNNVHVADDGSQTPGSAVKQHTKTAICIC